MESTRKIPLINRKRDVVAWTTVDEADYEYLMQHEWWLDTGYATRAVADDGQVYRIKMHNVIYYRKEQRRAVSVDHVNRDSLDNTRKNLRSATQAQQTHNRGLMKTNTTGLIGVSWVKKDKRFRAQIMVDGKYIYLGQFKDKYKAAAVRDAAALEHHGEFAVLNEVRV